LDTEDPAEFESGYLTNMLVLFQDASGYSKADMTRLMWNAFRAIWLPDPEKEDLVSELREYTTANGVNWNAVIGN
jgi:adenosine deaminase